MSVHVKKDGRVFVVWYDANGKQIWESYGRGEEAKKAAKTRDLEIRLAHSRGDFRPGVGGPSPTVQQIAQACINARRSELADKTRKEILRFMARHVLAPLGAKPVRDLKLADWSDLQDRMITGGTGNRTINTYFRYMNAILNWAVDQGYLEDNPWRKRKPLKQKKYRIELFTAEEFRKILDASPPHLYWALKVAYYTGLRPGPSELFALKWENVDFNTNRIRIYATKTDSWRVQYIPEAFMADLKRHYEESRAAEETSPYVCTWNDKPVKCLKRTWAAAQEAAGIGRRIRLYDIRHFYITHALAAGAPILDLAHRVGHTDATMIVKVYSHLVDEIKSKKAFELPLLP